MKLFWFHLDYLKHYTLKYCKEALDYFSLKQILLLIYFFRIFPPLVLQEYTFRR